MNIEELFKYGVTPVEGKEAGKECCKDVTEEILKR